MPDLREHSHPLLASSGIESDIIVGDVSDIIFPREFEDKFAEDQIQQGSRYYSANPEYKPDRPVDKPTDDELQEMRDSWTAEFADLLGEIPSQLPPFREINHGIPIVDENMRYHYHRPRCADAVQTVLTAKIKRYEDAGWWQPCMVEQAAPMLCILKKSGKLRTVVDLRQRNDNTVHDLTPLPDQDCIRNDLAQGAVRSKLDMSDAYEQIHIIPEDVRKTAFSTVFGTYYSFVMQQGDCNAPATFQRLMTHIFRDHIGKFVHVYLDDIFIYSSSVAEHEKHLRIVFETLRKAQLYLSKDKCNLYSKRMECLGHIIDDKGIHADADKMAKIRLWPMPKSYDDILRFLGLVQYLAHFMPDVSSYTAPLSAICANGAAFYWRPLHDKCFEMIKALACHNLILKPIRPESNEPIWLICDASTSGVGAYYGQGPDWKTCRPAGFMSRKFTNAQHSYATYEHETLAILEALLKWEDKLIGRSIRIVTDHKTLEFFSTQRKLSYQQMRWIDYLSRFTYTIQYVPGEENVVADALSRYYLGAEPELAQLGLGQDYVDADYRLDRDGENLTMARNEGVAELCVMRTRQQPKNQESLPEVVEPRDEEAGILGHAVVTPSNQATAGDASQIAEDPTVYESGHSGDSLRKEAEQTSEFLKVIRSHYSEDKFFVKIHGKPADFAAFEVKDDLIWSRNTAGDEVLCVPEAILDGRNIREVIIDAAHRVLGHLGAQKTIDYVRRWYCWPRMAKQIDQFCASCHVCQTTKTSNIKPAGKLHSLPIAERPWQSIAMDFLGPFPQVDGFNYLWVVTDRLTSLTHLIPINTRTTASELAYIFLKEIVRLHGVPDSIVSDHDYKFTSKFWTELQRLLGVKLLMSMVFHPQTDGTTERANHTISQILRSGIRPDQSNWVDLLPLTEFALNSCQSDSTGFAPFELTYGFLLRTLSTFNKIDASPGVRQFADNALENLMFAHDMIIESRVNQTHYTNCHRSAEPTIVEGGKAYLSTKNLNLPVHRARKLAPKYIGSFEVVKAHPNTSNYTLELPAELKRRRIHPTFHVSLPRPYVENDDTIFPGRILAAVYDFGQPDEAEYEVEEILSHSWVRNKLKFVVKWSLGDITTEPLEHVENLSTLDTYLELQGVASVDELPRPTSKWRNKST
jgi:hypothetical protein